VMPESGEGRGGRVPGKGKKKGDRWMMKSRATSSILPLSLFCGIRKRRKRKDMSEEERKKSSSFRHYPRGGKKRGGFHPKKGISKCHLGSRRGTGGGEEKKKNEKGGISPSSEKQRILIHYIYIQRLVL